MKVAMVVVVTGLLLMGSAPVPAAYAQEAAPPRIGITLSETLNSIAKDAATREDFREVPTPRADRLSDAVRVTVTVGDPQCFPGEDRWTGLEGLNRRAPRPLRPR